MTVRLNNLDELGTGVRPVEGFIDKAMESLDQSVKALVREAKWSSNLARESRRLVAELVAGDRPEEAVAKIKDMAVFHCLTHLPCKHFKTWIIKTCMEYRIPDWSNNYANEIPTGAFPPKGRLSEIAREIIEHVVPADDNIHGATRFFVVDIMHSADIDWRIDERVTILRTIAKDFKLAEPKDVASEPLYGELMGYHLLSPGTYRSGQKEVYVDKDGNTKGCERSGDGTMMFSFGGGRS